ncbi:MAG: SPOR domain-containing protein [Pseudomonadota bacterium]
MLLGSVWIVVVALAGGDWQCNKRDELWDCRSPSAMSTVPEPARPAVETSATAVDASVAAIKNTASASNNTASATNTGSATFQPQASIEDEPSVPPTEQNATPSAQRTEVEDAWVVQIGAFRSRDAAQAAASKLGYEGLVIMPIVRAGEDWYVLLLGEYAEKAKAQRAGDDFAKNSGGDFWVRSLRSLEKLQKT